MLLESGGSARGHFDDVESKAFGCHWTVRDKLIDIRVRATDYRGGTELERPKYGL
jgi:hypothetical protein